MRAWRKSQLLNLLQIWWEVLVSVWSMKNKWGLLLLSVMKQKTTRRPVCLMSSIQPLGVQGMKQSPRSPRASFPALMLVRLENRTHPLSFSKTSPDNYKRKVFTSEVMIQRGRLEEDSLFTRLHPSLEPQHWWPSQCQCGEWSPKAAALGAHAHCSSHWPLWCAAGSEDMCDQENKHYVLQQISNISSFQNEWLLFLF